MYSNVLRSCLSMLSLVAIASCQPASMTDSGVRERPESAIVAATEREPSSSKNAARSEDKAARALETESMVDDTKIPETILSALSPGEYCYKGSTDVEKINVRFKIDATNHVTGSVQGNIQDESVGQYVDYRQTIDGTLDGSNLNLDVATWINYNQQNEQTTWRVSKEVLEIGNNRLNNADCEVVSRVFQNEDGLEARDLVSEVNRGTQKQIYLEPGTNSATVSDSVLKSHRDVYSITAQGGQQLSLSLRSEEGGALFDIVTPSGIILWTKLQQATFSLAHTGDYQIIVGADAENATYDLDVTLE